MAFDSSQRTDETTSRCRHREARCSYSHPRQRPRQQHTQQHPRQHLRRQPGQHPRQQESHRSHHHPHRSTTPNHPQASLRSLRSHLSFPSPPSLLSLVSRLSLFLLLFVATSLSISCRPVGATRPDPIGASNAAQGLIGAVQSPTPSAAQGLLGAVQSPASSAAHGLMGAVHSPASARGLSAAQGLIGAVQSPTPSAAHGLIGAVQNPASNAAHGLIGAVQNPASSAAHGLIGAVQNPASSAAHGLIGAVQNPASSAAHGLIGAVQNPASSAAHGLIGAVQRPASVGMLSSAQGVFRAVQRPTAVGAASAAHALTLLPLSCFVARLKCDFAFNNSLGLVPLALLVSMVPNVPFTQGVLHTKGAPVLAGKLKPDCKAVNFLNMKIRKCPAFMVVPPSSKFNPGTPNILPCPAIRLATTTYNLKRFPIYSGACFTVHFSQLTIKIGSGPKGMVRLSPKDGNTQFPEARRCLVFRTL
ncbi:hypothetical protein CLOM_g18945 [Closterium sp. NIES-68]|nr:hypothetical protein CLOM_g18945 [Closterium sp. NIES-68]